MTEKQSLRAIGEELIALMEKADNLEEGEEFNLEAELDALTAKLDGKLGNILDYMFKLAGDIEGINAKVKHMQEVATIKSKRIGQLQNSLLRFMDAQGLVKLDLGEHMLQIKKNPPAVDITNELEIPDTYKKYVMETKTVNMTREERDKYQAISEKNQNENVKRDFSASLDKKAIMDAIKSGEEVPGATTKQGVKLEIK